MLMAKEMVCHDCMKNEGKAFLQTFIQRVVCPDCMEEAVERNSRVQSIALLREQIELGHVTSIYGKWFFQTESSIKMGPSSFHLVKEDGMDLINPRVNNGKLLMDLYFREEHFGLSAKKGVLQEKRLNGTVLQLRTVVMDTILYVSTEQNRYRWDK